MFTIEGDAFDFARKADIEIEALSKSAYLRRHGNSKWLREEVYPLSRLGLYFKQPGLEVFVKSINGDQPEDGSIRVSGFVDREFDVQVTYDHNYKEALRDELLDLEGIVSGAGQIHRDKKTNKIVADLGALDSEEHYERVAISIQKLVFKKIENFSVSANTILIVAFDEVKIGGIDGWIRLRDCISDQCELPEHAYEMIFLFNAATGIIVNLMRRPVRFEIG